MDPELTLNFDSLQDETNDGGINNSEIPSSRHEEERQPEINKEEKDKKTTEIISKKCNLNEQQKWRLLKIISSENYSAREIERKLINKKTEDIDKVLSELEEEIKDQIELNTQEDKREQNATNNTEVKNWWEKKETDVTNSILEVINWWEKNLEKAMEAKKNLEERFKRISENLKPTQEEINQKKSQISEDPNLKQKLEKIWLDSDTYLSYAITKEKILQSDNRNQDDNLKGFIEDLNKIDEYLWIPRSTEKWYPLSYNKDLLTPWTEAIKKEPSIQALEEDTKIGEWIESLEDCLILAKLYWYKWEYDENNLKELANKTQRTPEEEQQIRNFLSNDEIKNIREQHNERISNYTTWFAAQTPLFSIIRYLDYPKRSSETLQNKLSKTSWTKDIKEDFATIWENWELEIKGFIDNNPITLYYDFNNEKHNLRCDDILNIDNNSISLNKKWKTDLKINMPTIKEIGEKFKEINFWEILKKSKDIDDYKDTLFEAMNKKAEELFSNDEEIKRRINKNIEKNLTTQSICNTLIPEKFQSKINSDTNGETGETPIRKILKKIDNTTEHSTTNKLNKIKNCFNTLNNFLKGSNVTDPKNQINKISSPLKEYIVKLKIAQETENYATREENTSNFLSILTNESDVDNNKESINEETLETVIKHLSKPEKIPEDELNWFSEDFKLQLKIDEF